MWAAPITGAVDVGCPYSCFAPKCFAGAVVGGHAAIPRVSDVLFGTGMGLTLCGQAQRVALFS